MITLMDDQARIIRDLLKTLGKDEELNSAVNAAAGISDADTDEIFANIELQLSN